ncbi:MAG: hypothetical protein ACOYK8_05085 [Alphaproteobacteria bacterium]
MLHWFISILPDYWRQRLLDSLEQPYNNPPSLRGDIQPDQDVKQLLATPLLEGFLQKNAFYYLEKWQKNFGRKKYLAHAVGTPFWQLSGVFSSPGWNGAAASFPLMWFFYRKMPREGLTLLVLFIVLMGLERFYSLSLFLPYIFISIFCGTFGNAIYFSRWREIIAEIHIHQQLGGAISPEQWVKVRGGTSLRAGLAAGCIVLFFQFIVPLYVGVSKEASPIAAINADDPLSFMQGVSPSQLQNGLEYYRLIEGLIK